MDWLGHAFALIAVPLLLSLALLAWAGVGIFCIRAESVPWPGGWSRPQPLARPLSRGDRAAGVLILVVLAITQVQPIVWIGQAGSDSDRAGLIALSALFYLLELGWWVWLWRLPRETVYRTLPTDKASRDRAIVDDVAQFDAAYRAREQAAGGPEPNRLR